MKKAKPERRTPKRAGVQACRPAGGIKGAAATGLHARCTHAARGRHQLTAATPQNTEEVKCCNWNMGSVTAAVAVR
jgi:hypothetical protein